MVASREAGPAPALDSPSLQQRLSFAPIAGLRGLLRHVVPDTAVRWGAAAGRMAEGLGLGRPAVVDRNLAIAFPESSEARRHCLRRAFYANLGASVAELAVLQGPHREALLDRVRVEGLEHMRAAEATTKSGGVIVLTAHFGSWDLCAAAVAHLGYELSVVHRGFDNPLIEAMMSRIRGPGVEELKMGRSVLGVLRALRAGRKVALLLDQNAHRDEGIFAPFFSESACTRVGPAMIAMRWGYPVVPVFISRQEGGARHVVRVRPALEIEGRISEPGESEDAAALARNVARMNHAIEAVIREHPEQWLWLHRRWRTRPEGAGEGEAAERGLYPRRRGIGRRVRHNLRPT